MVAATHPPADASSDPRLARRPGGDLARSVFDQVTSTPALTVALVLFTILAAGVLQDLDLFLAKRWLYRLNPDLIPFAQNVLDRVASQIVCVPILAAVAIVLARRRRSWRPILIAALAEAAFIAGIGSMKVLLARGVTYERDPEFLEAGLLEMGTKGISYPSGHAAEAVLIYGAAVYIIARYSGASRRLVRGLRWAVVLICVNSVTVSFLLGWHWMTDLIGGLLAGGLFLRLIVDWDLRARRRRAEAAERAETTSGTAPELRLERTPRAPARAGVTGLTPSPTVHATCAACQRHIAPHLPLEVREKQHQRELEVRREASQGPALR